MSDFGEGEGDGGGDTVAFIFDKSNLEGALYVLKTTGEDAQCGCPVICPGSSIHCNVNKTFLPDDLGGKISKEEFNSFVAELDDVLGRTHWPMTPCICAHFCLPFSPVCAMFYCASQRTKGISTALAKANTAIAERGYYWETVGGNGLQFGYIAMLKVNTTANQKWMMEQGMMGQGMMEQGMLLTPPVEAPAVHYMQRETEPFVVRGVVVGVSVGSAGANNAEANNYA